MSKRQSPEHDLQVLCVAYFRYRYPELRPVFYAVPNGGDRNEIVAARLKAEGVTPGISDLILQLPAGGYTQLCIEMKDKRGRQTPEQELYQACATLAGALYVVCRSEEEFQRTVDSYVAKADPDLIRRLGEVARQADRARVQNIYEKIKKRTPKPEVINHKS